MSALKVKGIAHLCFTENGSTFCGLLVTESREQYSVRGRCHISHNHVDTHECCFDEHASLMELTVTDHGDFDDQYIIPDVMKSGGDNCSLTSNHIEFHTDELLVDAKADKCIEKFFSKSLTGKNCFVCVGEMNINYRKPNTDTEVDK